MEKLRRVAWSRVQYNTPDEAGENGWFLVRGNTTEVRERLGGEGWFRLNKSHAPRQWFQVCSFTDNGAAWYEHTPVFPTPEAALSFFGGTNAHSRAEDGDFPMLDLIADEARNRLWARKIAKGVLKSQEEIDKRRREEWKRSIAAGRREMVEQGFANAKPKFKKTKITVSTVDHSRIELDGFAYAGLLAHKTSRPGVKHYDLTHIASGKRVNGGYLLESMRQARCAVYLLSKLLDWTKSADEVTKGGNIQRVRWALHDARLVRGGS